MGGQRHVEVLGVRRHQVSESIEPGGGLLALFSGGHLLQKLLSACQYRLSSDSSFVFFISSGHGAGEDLFLSGLGAGKN